MANTHTPITVRPHLPHTALVFLPLPQADVPECISSDTNGKAPDASPSSDRYGRPEEKINNPEELVREDLVQIV